jgi:hypothetical protein
MTMSKSNVVDIATAETVEVEAPAAKAAVYKRDLAKIGRNLARQITKGSFTDLTVEAVMERKAVDRVQAKAVIAHAAKTLEGRGKPVPTFA